MEGRLVYQHTQQGRMFLITAAVLAVIVAILLAVVPERSTLIPLLLVTIVIVVVAAMFSRLTVSVDTTEVRAVFGTRWPRRRIALADVRSATPVRNRWYHGWGIRKVANGWMYNVWGLDAVELELTSGKVFRIGTDEPTALAAAIDARLGGRDGHSGRATRRSY